MNPNSSGESQRPIEAIPPSPTETGAGQAVEKTPTASPENSPQKALQVTRQVIDRAALPGQSMTVGDNDDAADTDDTAAASSSTAADGDRIEKEWIEKVKAVAAQTQDDPYEQKNAISHVKVDYIKKRFNKTLKSDDTVDK